MTITGFPLPDGGVCLAGDGIMALHKEASARWPWPEVATQGDTRAALCWPEREAGKSARRGVLLLSVLAPDGRLVVVAAEPFDAVSSHVEAGRVVEGCGVMVARLVGFGVRQFAVGADDMDACKLWVNMILKDASCRALRPRFEPVRDLDQALQVYREMVRMIVWPEALRERIRTADTAGALTSELLAGAMLAWSYRYTRQFRVLPESRRWEAWN